MKKKELTNKKLINLYWYVLLALGVISAINTLIFSRENHTQAQVYNLLLLLAIMFVFICGFVDYKNYKPLTEKMEVLYIVSGIVSLGLSLLFFNVEYYNPFQAGNEHYLNRLILSLLSAFIVSACVVCIFLILQYKSCGKKQKKALTITLLGIIVFNVMLIAFNGSTTLILFNNIIKRISILKPLMIDIGLFMLMIISMLLSIDLFKLSKKETLTNYKKVKILTVGMFFVYFIMVAILPSLRERAYYSNNIDHSDYIIYKIIKMISYLYILLAGVYFILINKRACINNKKLKLLAICWLIIFGIYLINDVIIPCLYFSLRYDIFINDRVLGLINTLGVAVFLISIAKIKHHEKEIKQ